jgi:acylphosphatase
VSRNVAKRYLVRGRVQGVGYRSFVQHAAIPLGVVGWVQNLEDGSVEVYAAGTDAQLSGLEDAMWKGPYGAEVRGVNSREDTIDSGLKGFRIR